jgi:hypothetical protein
MCTGGGLLGVWQCGIMSVKILNFREIDELLVVGIESHDS